MAYIDLQTLKLELGITDSDRDDLLNQAIDAAQGGIDRKTGRRGSSGLVFEQDASAAAREYRTRGRVNIAGDGEALIVDDIGDDADLVVEGGDGTTWTQLDASEYELEPDNAHTLGYPVTRIRRVDRLWRSYRRARVTAIWGWPVVPEDIKQATLLQAARLYRRKDSPEGVAGSAEWGLIRLPHLDPDVRALIAPYVLHGVA